MLYEFLYFVKLERRDVIIFKDLEKFKVIKRKIIVCKSGFGIKKGDFLILVITLYFWFYFLIMGI